MIGSSEYLKTPVFANLAPSRVSFTPSTATLGVPLYHGDRARTQRCRHSLEGFGRGFHILQRQGGAYDTKVLFHRYRVSTARTHRDVVSHVLVVSDIADRGEFSDGVAVLSSNWIP